MTAAAKAQAFWDHFKENWHEGPLLLGALGLAKLMGAW